MYIMQAYRPQVANTYTGIWNQVEQLNKYLNFASVFMIFMGMWTCIWQIQDDCRDDWMIRVSPMFWTPPWVKTMSDTNHDWVYVVPPLPSGKR